MISKGNTMVIQATVENLDSVLEYVESVLEEKLVPTKISIAMAIAVEELFVNIAHYAYAPAVGDAEILCECSDGVISVTFIDSGMEFNPLLRPDPDVTLSAADRSIGGLGIYMTKKSMDDMIYKREDGKNILTIIKNYR